MKDIFTRSLSGLIYVSLIIATLFIDAKWTVILLAGIGFLVLQEFLRLVKFEKAVWLYVIYAALFILIYFQEKFALGKSIGLLAVLANTYLAYFLFRKKDIPYTGLSIHLLSIFYIMAGILSLTAIAFSTDSISYIPRQLVSIFFLIWANDTFAYLVGVSFGKNKLFPSISPKKSVEGFIGGIGGAIVAALIISKYFYSEISLTHWIILAILAGVLGTIGDLVESKFKRKAGVKDSGKLMPGHGGVYDRLDSILYASPFIYVYLLYIM